MLSRSVPIAQCKVCPKTFERRNSMQSVCSPRCAMRLVAAQKRAEKDETRARRIALKSRADWHAEAQAAVNKYVRWRDLAAGRGCITCGARPAQKAGGTMDAGHFRSVGSAPHLRYWLPQIKIQCVTCNRYQGGRALDFRRALVVEHGAEWVERLEARQGVAKFTIEYLQRLKRVFTKKAKRLTKRLNHLEGLQ